MKRLLIFLLLLCCLTHALEYSHRIRSLGTDFACLIPDYETDLYRNPQMLEKGIAGLSYETAYAYYYRPHGFYPIFVSCKPLSPLLLTKSFGITGHYWFNYRHDLEPSAYGWESSAYQSYRFRDLWMCRMKKAIINIYNDLDYAKIEYLTSTNSRTEERLLEYLIQTQAALKLRQRLSLELKIGFGFYEDKNEIDNYEYHNKRINLGLARLGLYCRNVTRANDFTSWYVDIGSPISNAEIDSLPYSVYSHLADHETRFVMLAQTLIARFGIAKALPLTNQGFVAIGLKNTLLYQNTEDIAEDQDLRGVENTLSLPLAVEHQINTVALRFGTRLRYHFQSLREADENALSKQSIQHELGYDYSFGIGWQPHKNLVLDIYNNGNLWYLEDWAIYVKYLF